MSGNNKMSPFEGMNLTPSKSSTLYDVICQRCSHHQITRNPLQMCVKCSSLQISVTPVTGTVMKR
jgi:ribosomal protein S27E